jgi:hypothetical protein
LLRDVRATHQSDQLIVDELQICGGDGRADIAVIGEEMIGYEIKSEVDDIRKLYRQVEIYSRVFDGVYLVCTSNHLKAALAIIPYWWGVLRALDTDLNLWLEGRNGFELFRDAQPNPHRDPYAVAQLLWRDEALELLRDRGIERGVLSKPRRRLWQRLAYRVPLDELSVAVVDVLKARDDWKTERKAA